ncbi:MAG: TonB-dependent receptor, partial [Bdellovibrionales bacterium]|nr:TonB-dependent receptor [Bdellovibrionales bacterium]NQZ18189.1 TonB-dependent receptor [Bdellovibrionales bacterium]
NVSVGLLWGGFSGFLNYNYLGEMADQAVSGNRRFIPSRWVLDAVVRYDLQEHWQVYFKADNITAEDYAVSIRPQGLRPGKPQSFIVGMRYAFF